MKTQFTPGPWTAARLNDLESTRYFIKSNKSFVALVYDYDESTKSNASLIADCPTLLNVLNKCFITLVGEYPKDQWEEYYPEILEAKALLEKHLGDLGLEDEMEAYYNINVARPQGKCASFHYFSIRIQNRNVDFVKQVAKEMQEFYPDAKITITLWQGIGKLIELED